MPSANNDGAWRQYYLQSVHAIAHDLGAPLRHVKAFAELLAASELDLNEAQSQWLTHMVDASALGQAIVAGLLRLSRAQAARCAPQGVDVSTLGQRLGIPGPLGSSAQAKVDIDRLDTALRELTANADRYGGGHQLSASIDHHRLSIEITNHSGGIPSETWDQALLPLNRLGDRPTCDHVGVGLPIALALIENQDGSLVHQPGSIIIDLPLATG